MTTYQMTTLYLIVFDLILIGFVTEVLRRAGASTRIRVVAAMASALWVGFLAFMLQGGVLYSDHVSPTLFFVSILACVGAFTVVGLVTPIGKLLLQAPNELLMLPQGLRVFFGAGFLIEGVLGIMPSGYAIADGITHITAAFLCLKAGLLLGTGRANHGELWTANLFGLIDIVVVASGLSFFLLDRVGPHHNVMLAALFAAPVFINLHLASLWKLEAERRGFSSEHPQATNASSTAHGH